MKSGVWVGLTVAVWNGNAWWPAMVTRIWSQEGGEEQVDLVMFWNQGAEALRKVEKTDKVQPPSSQPVWNFLDEVQAFQQPGWS